MTIYRFSAPPSPFRSGSSSGVERKLPKLDVAGSTPVSRSNLSPHPLMTFCTTALICLLVAMFSGCASKQLPSQSPLDTPANHYLRGLVYVERDDLVLAQREFERARLLDADFPGAFVGTALVSMKQGDFWRARKEASTAIHRDAGFIDGHITMGRIVTAEGVERDYPVKDWLKEAVASYRKAIQKAPDHPATYYHQGHSYLQALNLVAARESFTRVLDIDRGPLVAKALAEVNTIQMIERAAPGTSIGLKITLIPQISRGEMAVLLMEEMQLPVLVSQRPPSLLPGGFRAPGGNPQADEPASDIDKSWAAPWIGEVLRLGVSGMELYPDHTFRPETSVTRTDYARVTQGVLVLLTGDTSLATKYVGETSRFPDVRGDFYGYNAIALSTERGIMAADKISGRFRPQDPVSGAQALLMMRELQSAFRREF